MLHRPLRLLRLIESQLTQPNTCMSRFSLSNGKTSLSATRIRYPVSRSSSESQRHGSSGPASCRMLVCYAADNMSFLLAGTARTLRMYLGRCFNRRAQLPGKRVDLATLPTVIIRNLSSPIAQTMYNGGNSKDCFRVKPKCTIFRPASSTEMASDLRTETLLESARGDDQRLTISYRSCYPYL